MDDECPEVVGNLRKAMQAWENFVRILGLEGADVQTLGWFYLAVVQATLLWGSEMWVVTPHTAKTLGGFRHRVAQRIKG